MKGGKYAKTLAKSQVRGKDIGRGEEDSKKVIQVQYGCHFILSLYQLMDPEWHFVEFLSVTSRCKTRHNAT